MMKEIIHTKDFVLITQVILELENHEFKKAVIELLNKFMELTNSNILNNAIKDKKITEEKITKLIKEYKVTRKDIGEAFKHFYDNGIKIDDKSNSKEIIILTTKNSGLYKLKNWLNENYNVKVILSNELLDIFQKLDLDNKDYIG